MAIGAAQKWYAGGAAAAVVVLTAGWFLLVTPQKSTAADISDQTTAAEQSNAQAQSQIDALKVQYADLPRLTAQVAAIRQHLPSTVNEPALLRTLQKLGASAGVKVESMQFQPPAIITGGTQVNAAAGVNPFQAAGQLSQIPVTVNITGPFANTRLFLSELESMQRVMLVTGLDINRAATQSGQATLQTAVSGRVFMANPGAPTVASPPAQTTSTGSSSSSSTTSPS